MREPAGARPGGGHLRWRGARPPVPPRRTGRLGLGARALPAAPRLRPCARCHRSARAARRLRPHGALRRRQPLPGRDARRGSAGTPAAHLAGRRRGEARRALPPRRHPARLHRLRHRGPRRARPGAHRVDRLARLPAGLEQRPRARPDPYGLGRHGRGGGQTRHPHRRPAGTAALGARAELVRVLVPAAGRNRRRHDARRGRRTRPRARHLHRRRQPGGGRDLRQPADPPHGRGVALHPRARDAARRPAARRALRRP
ncbi:hypothetical protein M2266_005771 [Streptomyces sp. SPB162]|nr:hypothetical protein [Streptomyces sp. SPB162]